MLLSHFYTKNLISAFIPASKILQLDLNSVKALKVVVEIESPKLTKRNLKRFYCI